MLDMIDALLAQYKELAPAAPPVSDDFACRFTFNSNVIEGNTLSEREAMWVIEHENGVVTGKPLEHSRDMTGHFRAFKVVQTLATVKVPITEHFVLDIHRDVLLSRPADAGRYRTVEVYLRGVDIELPKPKDVQPLMRRLIADYDAMKDEHPIVRTAFFHARFEGIHPFVDGNGRTGRLLLNYELLCGGYPPIDITPAERSRYFSCLQAFERGENDAQPMIEFVAEHVIKEIIAKTDHI